MSVFGFGYLFPHTLYANVIKVIEAPQASCLTGKDVVLQLRIHLKIRITLYCHSVTHFVNCLRSAGHCSFRDLEIRRASSWMSHFVCFNLSDLVGLFNFKS